MLLIQLLYIPPPPVAELPLKVTFVNVGLLTVVVHPAAVVARRVAAEGDVRQRRMLLDVLYIPPPLVAELPLKVTLVSVGLLDSRCTSRRRSVAELPLKVTLVNVGIAGWRCTSRRRYRWLQPQADIGIAAP